MKKDQILGFIGAGNMATALMKGLMESGVYDRDHLLAADKEEKALQTLTAQFGVRCHRSNDQLARESNIVLLSVKPQNMKEVVEEIKSEIRDDHLVISIAAGIPLKMILEIIGRETPLIRVMPNTPALVQEGVSALAAGGSAKPDHMAEARAIFGAVGETVEVEEAMMDAVTALSGSGPGYVFRIMEGLVRAGMRVGLEEETSLSLVTQTFLGAARLAKESDHSLSRLREMVTSPGGTTAAGLAVLNEMGLEEIIGKAVQAACDRSVELGGG